MFSECPTLIRAVTVRYGPLCWSFFALAHSLQPYDDIEELNHAQHYAHRRQEIPLRVKIDHGMLLQNGLFSFLFAVVCLDYMNSWQDGIPAVEKCLEGCANTFCKLTFNTFTMFEPLSLCLSCRHP